MSVRDISGSLARQSLLVAAVCAVADVGQFLLLAHARGHGWQVWVLLTATVLADAALAAQPRWSGVAAVAHAVLLAVGPVLTTGMGRPRSADNAGLLIAGYRAGAWLRTGQGAMALGALVAGIVLCRRLYGDRAVEDWRLDAIAVVTTGLLPWLVGRYTTARRGYLAESERELERRRRDEEEAVRRAVAEERSAIARDLHDVISHHVSAIGVHAGAARLTYQASGNGAVLRSLSTVESASRSAMADLRRLLDLLHGDESTSGRRQPGLSNLDELLAGVQSAGLPTRLTTSGAPGALPESLDIALYRIAQEALTNALRHGDGGTVDVELAYRPAEVTLSVTNDIDGLPGDERPTGGRPWQGRRRGLAGIRQRTALFGGRVSYGPVPEAKRWRVQVTFPLEPERP
jgi:signal transduction histidine kinase